MQTISASVRTSLIILSLSVSPMALMAEEDNPNTESTMVSTRAADDQGETSTVTYGLDFIQQQTGIVSVADLVMRIPGGTALLSQDGNSQRGFSNGNDRILINGRRLSGKQNDSRSALEQISVSQVQYVEVIRGSSPDIKVSSQDSLVNIVLRDDATGSGAWEAFGFWGDKGTPRGGATLSYTGSSGIIDYNIAAQFDSIDVRDKFDTLFLDGTGNPTKQLSERRAWDETKAEVRSNLTFNLANGDILNLNGLFGGNERRHPRPGNFFLPDANGNLTIQGNGKRELDISNRQWEVGGDYDHSLGEGLDLKILALYTQKQTDEDATEDSEILANGYEPDFRAISDSFTSEAIARGSLVWQANTDHRIEVGTEVALNKQETDFQFFLRQGGVLVQQNIASSDVVIKETRDESFAIHSWQISDKLSLDSSLLFEWSKISQSGSINKSRSFTYFKPSFDLRYNVSANDQWQFSIRRQISQLDFGDFASSLSGDNQVVGGNSNLEPERSWMYEVSFEHRLDNDNGSLKPSISYRTYANHLQQIETSPGISGTGNAGEADFLTLRLTFALRLFFLGLPNMQMSGDLNWQESSTTDSFTNQKVAIDGRGKGFGGKLELRHDIPAHGFSWGVKSWYNRANDYHDIDEASFDNINQFIPWVSVFAEKQILNGIMLNVEVENINDSNYRRQRNLYAAGRAGGILTSQEIRDAHWTRRLRVSLRGTF